MDTLVELQSGAVTILKLNRPQVLNALNKELLGEIEAALDRVESSPSVAIVITGEGRAFCPGTDLREPMSDVDGHVARWHRLAKRLIDYPKLSVAAINGLALGGGLELALACTLRVATPDAKLGLPEVKLSVMAGYGGTQMLSRTIGAQRALLMMLTGEPVSGNEALSIGLVDMVDSDPLGQAIALAERCTAYGQPVQRALRRAVLEGGRLELTEAFALEHELNNTLIGSPEAKAAIRAFTERKTRS